MRYFCSYLSGVTFFVLLSCQHKYSHLPCAGSEYFNFKILNKLSINEEQSSICNSEKREESGLDIIELRPICWNKIKEFVVDTDGSVNSV